MLAGPGIAADLTDAPAGQDAPAEQAGSTTTGGLDVPDAFYGPVNSSGSSQDLSVYGFEDCARIKHVMSYIGA